MIPAKTQAKKVVLITGAARRVGAAIAEALHQHGYDVAIHYHQSEGEAQALAAKLNQIRPDSAALFQADLLLKSEVSKLAKAVLAWQGRVDGLVNNASVFYSDARCADETMLQHMFTTNVYAPYWLSEALKPALSSIINIIDTHAERPLKGYSLYVQTKAALKLQTEAHAKAYAPHIRVNAVAPGAVMPPEGDNALDKATEEKICAKIPLARFGAPKDVAHAVICLMESPYITGQTLRVDGGRSLET